MKIEELCINCFKYTGGEEVCMHCGHVQNDRPRQLCHLFPHTVLNERYIIGSDINNGGFGVVYKAYDTKLETVVAIKELLPTQNSLVNRVPGTQKVLPVGDKKTEKFDVLKKKFLEEARLMAQFSQNEGIVHIYDFFEANDTAYQVMEYLEGENLREYLNKNSNKIPYETAIKIALPIMEILNVVHKQGVVHCDISPDNIFLCDSGKIKLIDFGAAKFNTSDAYEPGEDIVAKTGYTPPERYREKGKIGPFTDIYSVGAVLYRLLSGNVPEESIDRLEKDELPKLSKIGVDVPLYAEKAIMKALALKTELRFSTMENFISAVKGDKKADFPEEELRKKKMLKTAGVIACFIVMVVGVISALVIKNNNSLVPATSESITMWYIDNGDEGLNNRWENVEKHFSEYAIGQKDSLKDTKVEIIGVPADEYKEKLEKAFEDGEAPDVFQSPEEEFSGEIASLELLYDNLKEADFEKSFKIMKNLYAENNRIAPSFDMPVLYTYTDFKYISEPDKETEVDELINTKAKKGKFEYNLLCNPDAVLYSAYALGYDNNNSDIVEKLFNAARVFDDGQYVEPSTIFTRTDKNSQHYIGMMSEFSSISRESRAGQASFAVTQLTGKDVENFYVFPETFCVSADSSTSERQTAFLLLYYLVAEEVGQSDITRSNSNTYYLPMLSKAKENIGYADKYAIVYDSDKSDIEFALDDYNSLVDDADDVSDISKKKTSKFKDVKSVLD